MSCDCKIKSVLMHVIVSATAAGAAELRLDGTDPAILFGHPGNRATLKASCESAAPGINWLWPTELYASELSGGTATLELINVAPTCAKQREGRERAERACKAATHAATRERHGTFPSLLYARGSGTGYGNRSGHSRSARVGPK